MNDYRPATFTPDQLRLLMSNLDPSRVSNRNQGGSKLSYVEAHDIKAMLIRVFGFANFSSDLVAGRILRLEEIEVPETKWENGKKVNLTNPDGSQKMKRQWRAVAEATVRLTIHATGATYTEMAVSSQNGIDPGEVADFAIKTAESDAFKRCAIFLGAQFGLSLYAKGQTMDTVQVVYEPRQALVLYGPPQTDGANPATGEVAATPPAAPGGPTDEALARMQGSLAQGKPQG
jgi:recombination DNA repair RAD52 pathway protein